MYNNKSDVGSSVRRRYYYSFPDVFHYTPILFIIAIYCFCFSKLVRLFKNLKTKSGLILILTIILYHMTTEAVTKTLNKLEITYGPSTPV